MIIKNLIVGIDKHGKNLSCGDICSFKLENEKDYRTGMISYSPMDFAFVFIQSKDCFTPIFIKDTCNITYLQSMDETTAKNSIGCEYVELYNSDLETI